MTSPRLLEKYIAITLVYMIVLYSTKLIDDASEKFRFCGRLQPTKSLKSSPVLSRLHNHYRFI
jgi:hypothetical protein